MLRVQSISSNSGGDKIDGLLPSLSLLLYYNSLLIVSKFDVNFLLNVSNYILMLLILVILVLKKYQNNTSRF